MGLPVKNTDRETTAQGRFIDIMREKADLLSFMSAFTDETQALENALFQLFEGFNINTAVGAQLDAIGEIVGLARNGADDERYRVRIRVRMLLNRSSGTPNQILTIVNLILSGSVLTSKYKAYYPAAFTVELSGLATEAIAEEAGSALLAAAPAGVSAALIYSLEADTDTFTFADSTTPQESAFQSFAGAPIAGIDWEHLDELTAIADGAFKAFASHDGTAVAVGENGKVAYSVTDGQHWIEVDGGFGSSDINDVIWSDVCSLFVACGAGGKISTSADGKTWATGASGTSQELNGLLRTPFGGFIYAFGNNATIVYSIDGLSWLPMAYSGGAPVGDFLAGDFDDAESFNFVIAGTNGILVYGSGGLAVKVTSTFGSDTIRSVAARKTSAGTFIAVGDSGKAASSNYGGASWTARTSTFGSSQIQKAVRAASLFLISGAGGKLATSSDGVTWTARTSGVAVAIGALSYSSDDSLWFFADADGDVGYSSDATTWVVTDGNVNDEQALTLYSNDGQTFLAAGFSGDVSLTEEFVGGGKLAGVISNQ